MEPKLIIFLSFFFLSIQGKLHSQIIEINYHLGFDCSKQINGKNLRGGCVTNEKMRYTLHKNGKYFKSNKLVVENIFSQYKNGKFGKNLESDSLKNFRFSKKVSSNDFNQLIKYLDLVESSKKEVRDSVEDFQKQVISNWDKNTFELNQVKIWRIKRTAKKEYNNIATDSLVSRIIQFVKKENAGFLMSSVVEILGVSFEYKEKKYSLSQHNLGSVNVSWDIKIDENLFYVISPEINEIISQLLHKKMWAKKRINQFKKSKELKKAFITPQKSDALKQR